MRLKKTLSTLGFAATSLCLAQAVDAQNYHGSPGLGKAINNFVHGVLDQSLGRNGASNPAGHLGHDFGSFGGFGVPHGGFSHGGFAPGGFAHGGFGGVPFGGVPVGGQFGGCCGAVHSGAGSWATGLQPIGAGPYGFGGVVAPTTVPAPYYGGNFGGSLGGGFVPAPVVAPVRGGFPVAGPVGGPVGAPIGIPGGGFPGGGFPGGGYGAAPAQPYLSFAANGAPAQAGQPVPVPTQAFAAPTQQGFQAPAPQFRGQPVPVPAPGGLTQPQFAVPTGGAN